MNKQTAVDWLATYLKGITSLNCDEVIQQAKELEKEQQGYSEEEVELLLESYIKWEGTKGAIVAKIGLLMDYPYGVPDVFEYCIVEDGKSPEWKTVKLRM